MSQTAQPTQSSAPSPTIRRALRRVDVRLRAAASSRGLGTLGLVAAIGAAAGMAADFAWTLPGFARWGIWGFWVAAVASSLASGVIGPWLKRSRWIDLAAVAERSDPRLGERLTGSIALLDRANHAGGSPALIAALAEDAAGHAGRFDPSLVRGRGRPLRRLAIGLVAIGLVAAPSFARPDPFQTLALRFLAPWLDLERISRLALEVRPGDVVAALGADVVVEARVSPRFGSPEPPETATLEWTDEKGTAHRVRMTARPSPAPSGSSRSFESVVPRLAGSVDYRVSADSASSRAYRVEAVEPPKACEFSAKIEPPAYTKLPASDAKDPAKIEAVEGSRVVLSFDSCVAFRDFTLTLPSATPGQPLKVEGPSQSGMKHVTVAFDALASGPFVLTLRHHYLFPEVDGLPETRQIVVRPDRAPTLAVKGPQSPGEARPDDVLQVVVAARDDFAVVSAELHYEVRKASGGDSKAGQVALKLEGSGTPDARGVGSLALRDLGLEVGDSLGYRVRVLDNRPAPKGPNEAWSDARSLAIAAKAEPMIAKEDRLRRETFQSRLDEIRVANAANRRETEQLRYAADAAQRTGQAWDDGRDADLAAREVEARAIGDKLQLLARDLQDDPTFGPLARPTRQAAEVESEAGRAQLDRARKAPDSSKRLAELRQADTRLGALGQRLDEIRRRLDALAKLDVDRQKLRDLAAKEDDLASRADQGQQDKDRIAKDQDELRKALDELLAKSPGLRAGMLGAQAEEASKLAKAARALAEKQRAESRKTAEPSQATDPLMAIAAEQKQIEDDARRLALDVDEPLAENGRARVDTDAVKRAVAPIERGDLPDAVRRIEDAEDALRRLDRDVQDVPSDVKALARRLARRQELLANDLAAALGEARRKDVPADERAALVERSKPLLDRQAEIARLAAGLVAPEPQKGAAREAAQATERAAENLRDFQPRDSEERQNQARRALNQLVDALADPNQIRDEARRKLDEARRKAEEILRDLDRHLAETRPGLDKPDADAIAASDLADRVAPLIQRQNQATEALARLEVESRLVPQRDRAAARAVRLAGQIQAAKDQAPARRPDSKPVPPGRWHLLGPLPGLKAAAPFDVAKPVDLAAEIKGSDGKAYAWKPAPPEGDEGKIDLGRIFTKDDAKSAFAVAEIPSPTRRKARLSIGSDDTLTVWLNGKLVFNFEGSRGFNPGQDKVEVELIEGVNRLAVRCGNGNGEWQFAVNASPPPPEGFDPARAARLRETLASSRLDAQAALDRLGQKAQGKMPVDDLAAALAAELRQAADALALERSKPPEDDPTPRERAAEDRRRLASAIRNLPVAAEAPALRLEAARLAEAAGALDADPKAAKLAADAADALARRLADAIPPKEVAAALARAERALAADQADPAQVAERQAAIAAELIRERSAVGDQPSALRDDAEKAVREAADLAKQANHPNPTKPAPTPATLAEAEAHAAEALEAMAADPTPLVAEAKTPPAAPAIVPVDPALGLGPEQADRSADLARRQRQVRERLQAEMASRVTPQRDLRRDAQTLGRDLADLRDRAKELKARSQWQANSAADLAGEQAPKAMEKGAEQLAQGRLDQARESQRQAADLVERAAREAEDFAASLTAEAAGNPGEDANPANAKSASEGLANARESLQGISRKLSQAPPGPKGNDAAKAAAPQMRQAAEALRTAAQAAAQGPKAPTAGEPDPDNPDVTASEAGKADADLAALQDLVRKKTGRQWGELPGHLRTEILQLSQGRYRDDYARLIQLYFREIAVDAGKAGKP